MPLTRAGDFAGLALAGKPAVLVATRQSFSEPPALVRVNLKTGDTARLSAFNDALKNAKGTHFLIRSWRIHRRSPRTSQRHEIEPSNHLGHPVEFTDYIQRNSSISGENPKLRIRSHRHPRALDARRPFAKARTRRSTHPQRAIRVREIVAPVRTRNQRSKHSPRRSDRPTNSRPSFPKAKVKPRPAPNIRSRSSPASTNAV